MKRCAWLVVVATACGGGATSPGAAPPLPADDPHIAVVERSLGPEVQVRGEEKHFALRERMREHGIPAVSIAVFDNYELTWARAYGVVEAGAPAEVDTETTFLAGSISKSVNAYGVLLAVADGTLALDQPINELLTSWKLPDNDLTRGNAVTLRRLLSHTAGTTVHGFPGYAAGAAIPTLPQILDGTPPANTPAVRVDLAPGTKFRYSGGGITISQLALVDRTKQPYPVYMARRVLEPLGMTHSSFEQVLSPARLAHAAVGHGRNASAIEGKRHAYPEMAAAGLWTTPADLARFFIAVARGRAGMPSKVSRAIAEQMTTKVIDVEGDAVGLGVFLSEQHGARWFGHNGSDAGFQALAMASLEGGRGVVVMASSDNGYLIYNEIARAVLEAYGWPGAAPPLVRVALDPAQRSRFVGTYARGPAPFAIVERDGKLMMSFAFSPASELVPVAADEVASTDEPTRYKLAADGSLAIAQGGAAGPPATRLVGVHPLLELEAGRFDAAVARWRELAKADPTGAREHEQYANVLGYRMIDKRPADAVRVLRLIAAVFPDSSNAHDSLGEALARTGDKPGAIAEYELAITTLDADPRVPAADKPAHRVHAGEELAKLRK